MKTLLITLLLGTLGITGCSTVAVAPKDARNTPADRVQAPTLRTNDTATAVFVRDTGFLGGGVNFHIYVDGKDIIQLAPGERAEVKLDAGTRIIGVIPTDPFDWHTLLTIDQDLKPGQSYYYRVLFTDTSGAAMLQRFIPE